MQAERDANVLSQAASWQAPPHVRMHYMYRVSTVRHSAAARPRPRTGGKGLTDDVRTLVSVWVEHSLGDHTLDAQHGVGREVHFAMGSDPHYVASLRRASCRVSALRTGLWVSRSQTCRYAALDSHGDK